MGNSLGSDGESANGTAAMRFGVLAAIGIPHFLEDTIQSLSVTIYPPFMDETSLPQIERRPGG